jgi:hypothetical protein
MLIPLLIGWIQTAKSEVIVPANTVITWNNSILNNFIEMPEYPNYTFTEDFDCSSYTTYSSGSTETAAIWGCIGALSDSVGSSSSTSSTPTAADTTTTNNINNLGGGVAASTALTTALTALPQTSKESKLSCGVGTGAYSSKYAVGFGCASKLNERVDVNAGGSYVFGGSKSYGGGTLDSGVLKAGFVFKLGELNKSTQLSLNESKELKKEVNDLKAKNDEIISHNQKLLARLEKLENMALKFQTNLDVISMSKKD